MKTPIAIHGACGRMGQRLIVLANADPDLEVVAAIDAPNSQHLGADIGTVTGIGKLGVNVTAELPLSVNPEVIIDFTLPEVTGQILRVATSRKIPIVIATTGHSESEREEIASAAHDTAVLFSPSMSLVVNLLFQLVEQSALALKGNGFDVEIIERHHRHKKDSPSGTAMHFAKIIQKAMEIPHLVHGREGLVGERPANEIGMHAIRAGDNVGEHTILFSTMGETMELVHKGYSRDSYAKGALAAAKFLAGKGAGRYTMKDVLGL